MDVLHAQVAHASGFILQRIARIVVQRQVDHDLHALTGGIGKLRFRRLTGRQQRVIDLAEVPRVA